jgi:thiol-disulfide isomerase/thioredoxin
MNFSRYAFRQGMAVLSFILLTAAAGAQEKLQILPAHPRRGEAILVRYRPDAPGAVIPDTAKAVQMVFTYSNLYELPHAIELKKSGPFWEALLVLPPYATYATFILQSGDQKDQAATGRHFEIAVYDSLARRIRDGYLYEAYSLPAQLGRVPDLSRLQANLYERELQQYPDNYEAKLRLLNYQMATSGNEKQRAELRKKAEDVIAAKFFERPGNMGVLNRVTMGYLIIGENSRLDSIRQVVREKYPASEAGFELITSAILSEEDTATRISGLEQLLKKENPSNRKYLYDAHQALVKLYAARGQPSRALYHLSRSGQDSSPYRPETLKKQAEVLMRAGIGLDTARQIALEALSMAHRFPAGLIRYFPETGYLPAYVGPEQREEVTRKAQGNLLSLLALIDFKKGARQRALEEIQVALAASGDVETLANAGTLYSTLGRPEQAFDAYRKIMLQVPEDSESLGHMKAAYLAWKGGPDGWDEEMKALQQHWKEEMTARLKQEIIKVKAHDFVKGLVDLEGRPVSAGTIKNKIVVVDFWATWCVPCMQEMPYVQRVYEKFAGNDQVAFMVVNSGSKNELKDAQGWWGNKKYSFPVYYNTDGQIGDKLGFNFIPALYIIDKNGDIRFKTIGFEGPSIERKIEAAIELLQTAGAEL